MLLSANLLRPPASRTGGLLRSAGDVRALVLDCNRQFPEWKLPPVVSYQGLCREIAGMSFGELDMVGARPVIKGWGLSPHDERRSCLAHGRRGPQAPGVARRGVAKVSGSGH